jgi:hypothetical protein
MDLLAECVANGVAQPALRRVGIEPCMPEESHFDCRQGRGDRKPADAEGLAVLFGEALRDEPGVLA